MVQTVTYPKFVTPSWVKSNLRIDDAEAKTIGTALAMDQPAWDAVKDTATFAEAYLASFAEDPGVGADCRRALGKKVPPLFSLPVDDEVPELKGDTIAKKAFGYFANCARMAAERGETQKANELAMLEMLEFGGMATEAFALAHEVQHLKEYAPLLATARTVEELGLTLVLLEEGLEEAEAEGEARAQVSQAYTIGRLGSLAEMTVDAEDPVVALQDVAACLAEAARSAAAYMQISSAPLGTDTALTVLRESIDIVVEHMEGSEDENLIKMAEAVKKDADACEEHLIGREQACKARLMAQAVRQKALEASSAADEAARIEVKNLADAKKMEKQFLVANEYAKESCKMAKECAKYISSQSKVEANDKEAKALFSSIEKAFQGAREAASVDVQERAIAAAEAQKVAKDSLKDKPAAVPKESAEKSKSKESAPPAQEGDTDAQDKIAIARQNLLAGLKRFATKRWDTNLATQTLRRLTDRRKEVIGQLWEAVEKQDDAALSRAEKFIEQFRNTMDARRRLDAVVRVIGRGQVMDPRTAKWFTDSILDLAELADKFCQAHK